MTKEYYTEDSQSATINLNDDNEVIDLPINKEENLNILLKVDDLNDKNVKIQKEHLYWLDALRLFSSYLVVLVHSCEYALEDIPLFDKNWYASRFWNALSRPCVPLFIMISGVLFLDPKRNFSISKIYKKYIYRITKVLIFWNIIYATLCKFAINGIRTKYTFDKELTYRVYDEILMGKYHQWYLYMCIGLYAVTPLIRPICNDKKLTKYFIIFSLIFNQAIPFIFEVMKYFYNNRYIEDIGKLTGKFQINFIGGYTCHYILGHYLNRYEIKSKAKLILIGFVGIICSLFTYIIQIIISKKLKRQINDYEGYTKLNVVLASISIFVFFKYYVDKMLYFVYQNKFFKSFLLKLSSLTFGIYQVHVCYLELFRDLGIKYYNKNQLILLIVHSILVWIICAITIFIMKKIPFLKEVL